MTEWRQCLISEHASYFARRGSCESFHLGMFHQKGRCKQFPFVACLSKEPCHLGTIAIRPFWLATGKQLNYHRLWRHRRGDDLGDPCASRLQLLNHRFCLSHGGFGKRNKKIIQFCESFKKTVNLTNFNKNLTISNQPWFLLFSSARCMMKYQLNNVFYGNITCKREREAE